MVLPLPPEALQTLLRLEGVTPLRRLQGRETFLHRTPDGRPVVVKRTQAGARPDGAAEHAALTALAAQGLPVPAALGWARDDERSVVVLERVPHKESARDALARLRPAERRALLARVADLAARLHARGWHHRDLYLQHVLLREPDGALVLIDVGRARPAPPPRARWYVKDLAAALHSLPDAVLPRERLRFVLDYLDRRGVRGARRRRRWARAAFAKARRMAAHVPRDERAPARRGSR